MRRIRLRYESIQQMVGAEGLAVIVLTDEQRERALTLVCDEFAMRQILVRLQNPSICSTFLPEALVKMLPENGYELMVFGLHDGQYQVVLSDSEYQQTPRLRMSDAVLLTVIEPRIPLYIERNLFIRQSVAFDEKARGIAIPINTMNRRHLGELLQRAINEERYELASQVRDELKRRSDDDALKGNDGSVRKDDDNSALKDADDSYSE